MNETPCAHQRGSDALFRAEMKKIGEMGKERRDSSGPGAECSRDEKHVLRILLTPKKTHVYEEEDTTKICVSAELELPLHLESSQRV